MTIKVQRQVAEAIKLELNANPAEFSQRFTAKRQWGNRTDKMESMGSDILVDVIPYEIKKIVQADRRDLEYHVVTTIEIRRNLPSRENEQHTGDIPDAIVDGLADFSQEIHDYFAPSEGWDGRLDELEEAVWAGGAIKGPYIKNLIDRVFWVKVRLTHKVVVTPH